jgi:hypothetical protein
MTKDNIYTWIFNLVKGNLLDRSCSMGGTRIENAK